MSECVRNLDVDINKYLKKKHNTCCLNINIPVSFRVPSRFKLFLTNILFGQLFALLSVIQT